MTSGSDYRRGRHVVSAPHAHLVFESVCADLGATLVEYNGETEHVHLLVEYPPSLPVSRLVNSLKGVPSRMLRKHYTVCTHRDHLWNPSHFAASCGGAPISILRQYIENQQTPD